MHSSSRTWVSARVKQTPQQRDLNNARRKFCRNSPFWPENFDLAKHKREWEEGRMRHKRNKLADAVELAEERQRLQSRPPRWREAFDGREFATNHGPVLCYETIFCPAWRKGKAEIAPWPPKAEMKYEGDDRISTDKLHGRFPGAPRVEGNETVNWQHRGIIEQYDFDEFCYPIPQDVDIFLRTHWVADLEFSEEEGEEVLGKDLMRKLDPQDQC